MPEIIILDGRDFLVLDKLLINSQNYLYVIATDGSNDISILNEYEKEGSTFVKSITNPELVKEVFQKVAERII